MVINFMCVYIYIYIYIIHIYYIHNKNNQELALVAAHYYIFYYTFFPCGAATQRGS